MSDDFLTSCATAFLTATGWSVQAPDSERKFWANVFADEWQEFEVDALPKLCKQAYHEMVEDRMTVDSPRSLTRKMRSLWRNDYRGDDEEEQGEWVIEWVSNV